MENEVVMKSRVRLARNLNDYPFPNKLDDNTALEIIDKVQEAFLESNIYVKDEFDFYKIKDMSELEKISMIEEHIISLDLANNPKGAVLVKKDKKLSIMINEEDHIRIQAIYDGLNLEKAYELADKIDDLLEERLEFAFDENLGYLTSCPTNTGTGMRASVMIHLPALTQLGYMNDVYKISSQIGLAIRGIYGERSEAIGNIYQISNQLTLGRAEVNTIDSINRMAKEIISKEIQAREILRKKLGIRLEDDIFRSLGILENARIIDTLEAMKYLSNIKIGIEMGYISHLTLADINKLITDIQPAHQSIIYKSKCCDDRDINRAMHIRNILKNNHNE